MSDDAIHYDRNGHAVAFSGPDAVSVFAAASLKMHLKLFLETGIRPTRGVGLLRMNQLAGQYTGQTYRGRKGAEQAIRDLDAFVITMKTALPHVTEGE